MSAERVEFSFIPRTKGAREWPLNCWTTNPSKGMAAIVWCCEYSFALTCDEVSEAGEVATLRECCGRPAILKDYATQREYRP